MAGGASMDHAGQLAEVFLDLLVTEMFQPELCFHQVLFVGDYRGHFAHGLNRLGMKDQN